MGSVYRAGIAAAACLLWATPGAAAVIVAPDARSATFTTNEYGQFGVETTGTMGLPASDMVGLRGSLLFELIGGFNSSVVTFRYTLKNTSFGDNLGSSIASFGFNIAPDAKLVVLDGPFALAKKSGNFAGLGAREFCLFDGSNCNGGATEGVFVNTPQNLADGKDVLAIGTFTLEYAEAPKPMIFSDFVTRWQRVGDDQELSASGTGTVVPEPEQWAMMIAGFALVGGAMRARRRRDLALA